LAARRAGNAQSYAKCRPRMQQPPPDMRRPSAAQISPKTTEMRAKPRFPHVLPGIQPVGQGGARRFEPLGE